MENKKMSEFVRHTGIFPKRALNFWNAKREKKREELNPRPADYESAAMPLSHSGPYLP